jgi:hypothetical protein
MAALGHGPTLLRAEANDRSGGERSCESDLCGQVAPVTGYYTNPELSGQRWPSGFSNAPSQRGKDGVNDDSE